MPGNLEELTGSGGQQTDIAAVLATGVKTLSSNQEIVFTKYTKYVLPIDGFVFYIQQPDESVTVQGSLHYASNEEQNADETISINAVIFTALQPIQEFNSIAPDCMYIGTFDGIDFAFNQRRSYYQQAALHHYTGNAVYPTMRTQLLCNASEIPTEKILSNSTPLWMKLNKQVPIYPEYLVPDNIVPAYVAVEIESTSALQPIPRKYYTDNPRGPATLHYDQLMKDKVTLTVYGLDNNAVMQYVQYLMDYMGTYDDLGLMDGPTVVDVVRVQSELNVRAQKKQIHFEVSYYQSAAYDSAYQLIKHTIPFFDVVGVMDGPGYRVPPSGFPATV